MKRPEVGTKAVLSEIDPAELAQVGGGYDDGNWCGTVPLRIHWPVPPLPWVEFQQSIVATQGALLQRGGLMP
jgi:hypothetical protein